MILSKLPTTLTRQEFLSTLFTSGFPIPIIVPATQLMSKKHFKWISILFLIHFVSSNSSITMGIFSSPLTMPIPTPIPLSHSNMYFSAIHQQSFYSHPHHPLIHACAPAHSTLFLPLLVSKFQEGRDMTYPEIQLWAWHIIHTQ